MTIRILVTAVGIVLMLASPGWAQSSTRSTASATGTTTFNSLSPGNQKIANALFSAQKTAGTTRTPLTKDQIAGLKGTEGWGKVFKEMKADGLVQARNLGQVVSANQHQLNASMRGAGGTTAGRASTASAARRGSVSNAGMASGRGFAGGSRAMGGGVAVSSMGNGGFGHAGMGGMGGGGMGGGGMGGGGFGHAGMGGGMGGGGFGGGGGGGRGR